MADNPYQAQEIELLTKTRRRAPNAFQRAFSAIFMFLGSALTVMALLLVLSDKLSPVVAITGVRAALAGVFLGGLMVGVGVLIRRTEY